MMPLGIGVILAVVVAAAARLTRFDVDRSYYATALMIIASYYVLFELMAEEAILFEISAATLFSCVAIFGAYRWAPLIGIGIILHGVFDFVHPHIIQSSGVPARWPEFRGSNRYCVGRVGHLLGSSPQSPTISWRRYLTSPCKGRNFRFAFSYTSVLPAMAGVRTQGRAL